MPVKKPEWYIYMVRCRDGSLYTGIATDIARRFAEHQSGKGGKAPAWQGSLKLAFIKRIGSRSLVLRLMAIARGSKSTVTRMLPQRGGGNKARLRPYTFYRENTSRQGIIDIL